MLLVVLSSVRRDTTKLFGGPISMGFDRLARMAIVFEEAYALTNSEALSMTSILSGIHPAILGPYPPIAVASTFLRELRRSGVFTACIDLEPFNPLSHEFDVFVEPRSIQSLSAESPRAWGLSKALAVFRRGGESRERDPRYGCMEAIDVVMDLVQRAIESGKRFLIVARLWDSHVPYRAPQSMARKLPSPKPMPRKRISDVRKRVSGPWIEFLGECLGWRTHVEDVAKSYSASIAIEGSAINELINRVTALAPRMDIAVMFVADHGESLGEHDVWFHHHGLYETNLRIPLAIYVPGFTPRRVRGRVTHIDVAPTIARLLGVEARTPIKGMDLLTAIELGGVDRQELFFVEYRAQRRAAVLINDMKFVTPIGPNAVCRYCNTIHGGVEELYNVRRDPLEDYNIADYSRDLVKEMRRRIAELHREALRIRIALATARSITGSYAEKGLH